MAAAMMLQRRRAREKLTDFARFIQIPGVPAAGEDLPPGANPDEILNQVETDLAPHHVLILDTCQDLVDDKLRYYVDDQGEL